MRRLVPHCTLHMNERPRAFTPTRPPHLFQPAKKKAKRKLEVEVSDAAPAKKKKVPTVTPTASPTSSDLENEGVAAAAAATVVVDAGAVCNTAAEAEAAAAQSPEQFRAAHSITIKGVSPAPAPIMRFTDTPFPAPAISALTRAGFAAPSPIQAQSWPVTLQGRDMISVAKTGSGKTLGFLLPAFKHLAEQRTRQARGDAPLVLVLAPTRELAVQIQDECDKFGRACRVRSVTLFGGAPKFGQIRQLQAGVDLVVATPGRLNDLLEMGKVSVGSVSYLVFDEADRMLDMGFEPQIRQVTCASSCPAIHLSNEL